MMQIGAVGTANPPVAGKAGSTGNDPKLRRACAEFESIFLHYLLKSARKGLPGNGLFDKTNESKIYQSMLDEQMALSIALGRGLGLGDVLYDSLQQASDNTSSKVSQEGFLRH